jgi:hypothetical protein
MKLFHGLESSNTSQRCWLTSRRAPYNSLAFPPCPTIHLLDVKHNLCLSDSALSTSVSLSLYLWFFNYSSSSVMSSVHFPQYFGKGHIIPHMLTVPSHFISFSLATHIFSRMLNSFMHIQKCSLLTFQCPCHLRLG